MSADGLIVTNFHVASQLALEPERYRGVYVTMEGRRARWSCWRLTCSATWPCCAQGRTAAAPVLGFRPAAEALAQGERIYSLGNPLDIGFAVTEGTYNGWSSAAFTRASFWRRSTPA